VYAFAANFTAGDPTATEALVERVMSAAFAPVHAGTTVTLELAQLLHDVRRAVLADANSEHGEGRRLVLVLGVDEAARVPRPGYIDELVRRVESGSLASTRRQHQRQRQRQHEGQRQHQRQRGRAVRWFAVTGVVALVVAIVIGERHGDTAFVGVPSPTTAPASLAATRSHQNLKTTGSSVDAVRTYLVALAQERYDDAATVLRGGAVSLDRRADLRPIFDQLADLPTALGDWCRQQAICRVPDSLVDNGNEVQATFRVEGEDVHQSFGSGVYHGSTFVRGLPLRVPQPLRREQPWGLMLTLCPTDGVVSVISADLDGDGWYEQVVLQNDGRSSGWSMTICGTYLSTRLVHLPPYPDLRVYPVHVGDRDVLLVGNEDASSTFRGKVWSFDRDRGGAGFSVNQFAIAAGAGSDLGCLDVNGDGTPDLVKVTIDFQGGHDVADSSSFQYTAFPVWPQSVTGSASGTVGLWPHSTSLPPEFAGYCGDRPIVVN
jgi:hypothetical protein